MAAFFSIDLLSNEISVLSRAYDTSANTLTLASDSECQSWDTWLYAQAAAFTLTMGHLSTSLDSTKCFNELLFSVPWLSGPLENPITEERCSKLAAIHTLANRAVGFFCSKLRLARAAAAGQDVANVHLFSEPPSATSIPLAKLMDLPVPFSSNSLCNFSTCHLQAMTNPAFFVNQEWAGYVGVKVGEDFQSFAGVGDNHHDGHGGMNDDGIYFSTPPGDLPYGRDFEGVIRFRLIRERSPEVFELQSNNLYTKALLYHLSIIVHRKTGQIQLTHWNSLHTTRSDGAVTPFGIVTPILIGHAWMWLWPAEWCL